ncbi:MAG: hypothetical protein KKD48_04925 [Nanoarchaeota archaeon]|nr:hypothetical protein [Nanoarchaeota archaeon]
MRMKEVLSQDEIKICGELSDYFKSITNNEFKYILKTLKEKGIDYQKIDFFSMGTDTDYDIMCGYIFQEYGIEIEYPNKITNKTTNKSATIGKDDMYFWSEVVKEVNSVVVYGAKGTGKTAFSHRVLGYIRKYTNRPIYCFSYPKPNLIKKIAWKNMRSIEEMNRLRGVALWIDEPQNYWKLYDGRSNEALAKLLSLARQRDIFLVLSTSLSQWVTRMLEGQIDVWVIKDTDPDLIKQGSRAKKIIQDNCTLDIDGFKLEENEYLFYCRKFYDRFNGRYTFELPKYWNDEYSKPFA